MYDVRCACKLQVIFHKRATIYRSLLRKVPYEYLNVRCRYLNVRCVWTVSWLSRNSPYHQGGRHSKNWQCTAFLKKSAKMYCVLEKSEKDSSSDMSDYVLRSGKVWKSLCGKVWKRLCLCGKDYVEKFFRLFHIVFFRLFHKTFPHSHSQT